MADIVGAPVTFHPNGSKVGEVVAATRREGGGWTVDIRVDDDLPDRVLAGQVPELARPDLYGREFCLYAGPECDDAGCCQDLR